MNLQFLHLFLNHVFWAHFNIVTFKNELQTGNADIDIFLLKFEPNIFASYLQSTLRFVRLGHDPDTSRHSSNSCIGPRKLLMGMCATFDFYFFNCIKLVHGPEIVVYGLSRPAVRKTI